MATLKEIRINKVMSQADLSRKSGVTIATISRIEMGHNKPRFVTIHKFAEALGVEPNTIDFT